MKKVELLAPVGSYEALIAAVQNGADAVYLGGKKFGARQNASNFDGDSLVRAVEYCHIRGVRVYVTVNTLVSDEELEGFMEYIGFLYDIDVDAIIIQDLGALKYIRESFPDFEVHSSTQMTIHNLEGIKLLQDLGVKRTVLAREMGLRDIRYIKENSEMEIEVFVHGALCISYSGQCLMSSIIGGRSGNRGRCAQPCRLPYKLVDLETKKEINSRHGDYILSPRDLNTLENLDKLMELKIESLKIEGRMKRPEYVAVVVGAYRSAIDMYYKNGKIKIDDDTKRELLQIFNREFTGGHVLGEKGKRLMGFEKPGNRGMEIGQVIINDKGKKRVKVKLIDKLQRGDGIEVRGSKKENPGIKVGRIFRGTEIIEKALDGEIIEIEFRGEAARGDKVFKTSDTQLLSKASKTYKSENKKIPIFGAVKLTLGDEPKLYIWDNDGNYITTQGSQRVERAINRPLDGDRVLKQLKKLGNTPYYFEKIELDIDKGVTVSISEINNIRREAVEGLNNLRRNMNRREKIDSRYPLSVNTILSKERKNSTSLAVYVGNLEQLDAVLSTEIDTIYYSDIINIEKAFNMAGKARKLLIPALNRITSDKELKIIEEKRDILIQNKGILLSNHGQLNMFRHEDINIYVDFSLNIFNSLAVEKLIELNVSRFTLSPELNYNQIRNLSSKTNKDCEIIAYGHLPMMVMEYCPIKALVSKGDEEIHGLCKSMKYGIKDRYGIVFPLLTDNSCRTQVLNSKKLFLLENIEKIVKSNVRIMRLQFTNEDKNEIIGIVKVYSEALTRTIKGGKGLADEAIEFIGRYKEKGDYTKGHFLRGVI